MAFQQHKSHIRSSYGKDAIAGRGSVDTKPTLTPPSFPLDTPEPVSIVIPTLNEADNITELLTRLTQSMVRAAIPYEVIVVDDHSTDNTIHVIEQLAQQQALPVRVLLKQGRPGKSFSLMEGFAAARFDILAMIDGDLQYSPEVFPIMVEELVHADIVVADRRTTYLGANLLRGGLSQIFTKTISLLFGIDTDIQSGMKMFRRSLYDEQTMDPGKWSFDLYLITHAVFHEYRLKNVHIDYQKRYRGESKISLVKVSAELSLFALKLKVLWIRRLSAYAKERMNILTKYKNMASDVYYVLHGSAVRINRSKMKKVIGYAKWLMEEETQNNNMSLHEETNEYIDAALQETTIQGRRVRTFAPFDTKTSAFKTFTVGQVVFFTLCLMTFVLGSLFFRVGMAIVLISFITVFYIFDLLLMFVLSLRTLDQACEERIDDAVVKALPDTNWPLYTVLCPLYHEAAVVPQFVAAMKALDYPTDRLQVLFLIEEHDVETRDAIHAMNLPLHFRVMTVPPGEPRTKPRACNFGLLHAKGDYIVIFDAEDKPDPLQLKKAVLVFANHGASLGCVQAKLNFYNVEQNLLTRLFTAEYSTWFDLTLPSLQQANLALPLGGTSNHFRTATLGQLGAWDAFNVTEDCDLGLRLARFGLKTTVLDSTTYEEANSDLKNWFRQRSRWIKGYLQTYLIHMRRPWRYLHPSNWRNFFALQFIVGGKTALLLINPIMWLSLIIYILFHFFLKDIYQVLFPVFALYMGSFCLIFGNFLYTNLHLAGALKRGHYKVLKWALLMPFYWLLSSGAALLALYQLIVKPHYWEKTVHGLHLKQKAKESEAQVNYEPASQSAMPKGAQETPV